MGLGLLLEYMMVACEGTGALYPIEFHYRRSITTLWAVSYELDFIWTFLANYVSQPGQQ